MFDRKDRNLIFEVFTFVFFYKYNFQFYRPNFPETYFGYVGKHFNQMLIEDSELKIYFSEIVQHYNYNAYTFASDIALMKVGP